jgi:hypothetical protein
MFSAVLTARRPDLVFVLLWVQMLRTVMVAFGLIGRDSILDEQVSCPQVRDDTGRAMPAASRQFGAGIPVRVV